MDFRHRLITVEAAYAKNGKTGSIPLSDILTETLKTIRIHGAPAVSVFLSRDGTPYRDISTAFATTVRRARIPDFTFHDLHHCFASRLAMAGVDLTAVKELLGHKHIAMTLRYAHLAPGHKRVAIAVLDRYQEKVPAIFTTDKVEKSRPILQAFEK